MTPVSEAAYGGVDTGCIVTHVNGVAAPDIFELMDMLTGYPLPIRLTFLNPFAIPGPVSAPTAVCAPRKFSP